MTAILAILACSQLPGEPVCRWLPVSDICWFPPREVCQLNLSVADKHLAWLEHQVILDGPRGGWQLWLCEARQCRLAWYVLDDAWWYRSERGKHLLRLRELLGHDDYYVGRMPPPVPLHRFRHLR